MKVTENQREFLLEYFFYNDEYPGWKNIANKLIDNGKVVIPNINDKIWIGGIGNFIEITDGSDDFVDCIQYNFDLKDFLTSEYYKDIRKQYLTQQLAQLADLREEIKDIEDLL